MTSLNPTMRVGKQIVEVAGSSDEALRLLDAVGVPEPGGACAPTRTSSPAACASA